MVSPTRALCMDWLTCGGSCSESQVTWEVRWGSVGVSHVPRVTMSGELDSNYQRSETPWLRDVSASNASG